MGICDVSQFRENISMARPLRLTPTTKGLVFEFVQTGEKVRPGENMGTVLGKDFLAVAVFSKMKGVVPDGLAKLRE